MKTIETKISKSGATIYYVDGKRTSRENAMFVQRMNNREAEWLAKIEAEKAERENELATVNNEVTETVTKKFTTVKAENAEHAVEILGELNFRNVTFEYHGENYSNDYQIAYRHFDGINADGNDTCFGLIEIVINGKLDAVRFINNYREQFTDIKIGDAKYTVGDKGEINLIDEPTVKTDTPEEKVEKLFDAYEAQNSVAHISENGYIAAVNYQPQSDVHWHCKIRRYQNLDEAIDAVRYVNENDTFTVTRGGRVEAEFGKRNERTRDYFARTLYGVEYFKEAYFDELADQYAVTEDAFNFAVEYEIEEAEYAAYVERSRARMLADENLQKRYVDAKSQVKCDISKYGYISWYFKGKHSDDWEHNETKAAACLTRYGLSRFEFSVLSEDETAVIAGNGYDESAFDLLPTVDELNDSRSDIEKEFDEFAAEDTDRDARFNHGERHAAKLEKKLRELDPTVEVTYDIDTDGEDTFYLRFGKYVYRSPFATLDAVEETFHLWREDDRADYELAKRMIDAFKQANEFTAKLLTATDEAGYMTVTCQDGATILAHFKGAKITVDEDGYDILTAWDRFLGHYDTPAQVTAVINRIKACVDANIYEFTFPTLAELTAPDYYENRYRNVQARLLG